MKIITQSPKMLEILRTADLAATTDVPVLIIGQIGTGKDSCALRVHQQSRRNKRPFIKVNCSSLLVEDAEEMLFGAKGYLWQARSGSLFLDKVSELPPQIQARLLHFIETAEVTTTARAGVQKYDVRIIASTDHELSLDVEKGAFRADLFYQLNIISLELPPLKERDGDVDLLSDYFFRQFVRHQHQAAPEFSKAATKYIRRYDWPGNVRELHNFCERMYILFGGKTVDVANLPHELLHYGKNDASPFSLPSSGIKLDQVEVDLIRQALQNTGGNKSRAARLLGLTRDTFLYRLKKYAIDF